MVIPVMPEQTYVGSEHWTTKGEVDLFLWQKKVPSGTPKATVLFVHGSSMASTPTFDLHVDGRPYSSAMDWFVSQGFDTWCVDMEGYGRSHKDPSFTANIAAGGDDLIAATDYIMAKTGVSSFLVYGISSGALRAANFAERKPERVAKLALDAMVWTGEGSPTLEQRAKNLARWQTGERRPIDRDFVWSIFNRDHPGCADANVVEAFAEAIVALDDSVPTGTYLDMCANLPVTDPANLTMPTLVMRGEFDGIAGIDDLLAFYKALPHPGKQFSVMQGISHASLQQKNYMMVYHILQSFFEQPDPVYTGDGA